MSKMFTCEKIHMDIPEESQRGFCAKKYRIAGEGDICLGCETGKAAAKIDAETVRSSLPATTGDKIRAGMRAAEIRKSDSKEKEAGEMAGKKKCKKGCGKQAVKDDLCYKDYKAEHGVAPWGSGQVEAKKSAKAKARPGQALSSSGKKSRVKSNGHALVAGECEGCKKLNMTMAILVTTGLVSEDTVKQTQEFVNTSILNGM